MDEKQLLIHLGYAITEWKIMYYRPHLVHKSWHPYVEVTNDFYDSAESLYKQLCEKYGEDPVATACPEIDLDRGSVKLALEKLGKKKSHNRPALTIQQTQEAIAKMVPPSRSRRKSS